MFNEIEMLIRFLGVVVVLVSTSTMAMSDGTDEAKAIADVTTGSLAGRNNSIAQPEAERLDVSIAFPLREHL